MSSSESEWDLRFDLGGSIGIRSMLGLVFVCVVILASSGSARESKCYSAPDTCYVCYDTTEQPWHIVGLDLGACDTVRIGTPICPIDSSVAIGDSIAIPIYLYSTNAIAGFTLGFRHTGRGLKFGGYGDIWDPAGGILLPNQWGGINYLIDTFENGQPKTDSASALLGWLDITGKKPIARNTTNAAKLLGTVYLVLTDSIHQTIRFDSLFYPPAGLFILSCRDSTGPTSYIDVMLTPQFVMWEGTFPPCDTGGTTWICGDADGDKAIDIADAVYLVFYIFAGGAAPQPIEQGDADCSGSIDIADAVWLVNYIFAGGPVPCAGCK